MRVLPLLQGWLSLLGVVLAVYLLNQVFSTGCQGRWVPWEMSAHWWGRMLYLGRCGDFMAQSPKNNRINFSEVSFLALNKKMHLLFPHLAWTTSNRSFVPTLPSSYTTSIYTWLFNLLAIVTISAHPNLNSFIASSRSLEEELPR